MARPKCADARFGRAAARDGGKVPQKRHFNQLDQKQAEFRGVFGAIMQYLLNNCVFGQIWIPATCDSEATDGFWAGYTAACFREFGSLRETPCLLPLGERGPYPQGYKAHTPRGGRLVPLGGRKPYP